MTAPIRHNRTYLEDLLGELKAALGDDAVITEEATCVLYAQDVFTKAEAALAVIRPRSTADLATAVTKAATAGVAIIPRGGGMSYTKGFVPAEADSIIVDMGAMDRIIEISEDNMTVTVEAGCTWAKLHQALAPRGLRTPFWGTMSGIKATIGGGLSQNGLFWGCGRYGSAVESVLTLEVVAANGQIIRTGSAAHAHADPFTRYYGPDLTGLFLSDAGALGFKAQATFKLMKIPAARAFASFNFDTDAALIGAMNEIARQDLASECFAFDPNLNAIRRKRQSLAADAKALGQVVKKSGGVIKGLKEGAKIAMAGRGFMDDVAYPLHITCEARSQAAVDEDVAAVRAICIARGGTEIENSIPKILAANPFGEVNTMIGPDGERWVPVHCLVPLSGAKAMLDGIEAVFARHQETLRRFNIFYGYMFLTVSTHQFLIEPIFLWPDALTEIHHASVDESVLKRVTGFAEDMEARQAVNTIRTDLIDYFAQSGATHLQIGKTYPYQKTLSPEAKALLDTVKRHLDPDRRINPGSLGL